MSATVKTIHLDFDGYWREANKAGVPAKSGIYLAYVCRYSKGGNSVTLDNLIYIGEAEDVRDRISDHEKWADWRKEVPKGSEICFSFARVASPDRERAECALINYHKPKCNDECKDSFAYPDTRVESKGRCAKITSPITVRKST
ncbi:MAG: GIY-YIG nuclease family protein [Thermoplasmata archaeon]